MNADDLFTAPQVARICSTDLKTIHNWVNRGEIKSFRTPGRHLRFRRQDILDFLTRFGYPIPDGFAPAKRRVVLVEEDDGSLRTMKRTLSRDYEVDAFSDHVDALLAIGQYQPHLVLINGDAIRGDEIMHMVERLASKKEASAIAVYSTDLSREEQLRQAGATEFIPTNDSKEIRRRIFTLLGK